MKIGNIEFGSQPVFLAPMEDVTDIGFRLLCKRFGASMVYTEFVSAEALIRDVKTTQQKLVISDEELRAMRDVLDLQRFYVEKNGENSSDQIKNQDSEFHRLFYRSSGSKSYYNTLFALHKRMTKFRKASVSKQSRAMQSHQEHEAIFAALEAHDPDAAEKAALAHVQNARARMQSMMEG